jgi:glyoxylase-like metal-dependent hydrolase (beta-lactamase superfamily II)
LSYCDLHRLGQNIIVIEGRELILGQQGDVAQIVLHRQGDLLTVIDSGAYGEDREAIVRAAQELGNVARVVLLNSHGHVDHVGNNDVIYEMAGLAEHYIPKKDFANLCDQAGFFERLMDESIRYLEMGSPRQTVEKLMRMFPELRANSDRVAMLEDRFELQDLTLGGVSFSAFPVGPVLAIPTEGHTIGHLCFLFPQEGFFYGADEFIGPVAPWGDSSPVNQLKACRLVIDLVKAGVVKHAARGHHWGIVSGEEFAVALEEIIAETEQWEGAMRELLASKPQTVFSLLEAMRARLPHSFGPNANPIFDTMKVLESCHRLGASEEGQAPGTLFSLNQA